MIPGAVFNAGVGLTGWPGSVMGPGSGMGPGVVTGPDVVTGPGSAGIFDAAGNRIAGVACLAFSIAASAQGAIIRGLE